MSKESAQFSLAELSKYGVFAKVDISDDSESWRIYGSNAAYEGAEYSLELAPQHFLILSRSAIEQSDKDNSIWWQQEILSGRAHLSEQTSQEYVPQMLNMQALDYISFNKGCYMGQEMVARMRYLGKNKRALYIAEIDEEIKIPTGTDVAIEINENKRNIGKVIQSQAAKGKTVVQLILPKDTELSERIYLDSNQDKVLKLLELPYSLDQ
jgi:folate-binding protein YgfZ